MPEQSGYVHGTHGEEQARLADLNALTNAPFLKHLALRGNERICNMGCGLALLDAAIAAAFPDVRITGVERSGDYAALARQRTAPFGNVRIHEADALRSGLPDAEFDLTFCRYVLEHVSEPGRLAREMIRVTRPGGRVIAQENDLRNLTYYPPLPGHEEVLGAFCELQIQLGGDPYVGSKLYALFDVPETARIDLDLVPENHTARSPRDYRAWVSNLLRIFEGAAEGMLNRGLVRPAVLAEHLDAMRARIAYPDGVAYFHWNRLTALRR